MFIYNIFRMLVLQNPEINVCSNKIDLLRSVANKDIREREYFVLYKRLIYQKTFCLLWKHGVMVILLICQEDFQNRS